MKTALRDLGCLDCELSIWLTDDQNIEELNRHYLKREGPTNVLAFPMTDGTEVGPDTGMLGDIVISVDRALEESRAFGESLGDSVDRLLIHGLLHLLNYDHERSIKEEKRMAEEQKRLLALIKE